jgi:hypothetical protein
VYYVDNPLSEIYSNQIPGKIVVPLGYSTQKLS